jgi:predicted methyltransferase
MDRRTENQVLRALKEGPKTFWELINDQDAHIAGFYQTLQKLLEKGEIAYRDHRFFLLKDKGIRKKIETLCLTCGMGVEIKGPFQEIYHRFLEATENRPPPLEDFDQGFVRPIDTIKRMAFIYERGDLEGTTIFILGDDDLLSIAMGLTGMAQAITVVEIDERLTSFIQDFCKVEGITNITVRKYNVLEDLPPEEVNRYNMFVTDPVETRRGFKLFVGRCISALKRPGSSGYIGLTHREASLKKWAHFQRFFLDSGMVVTDILRNLATYPEKENQFEHFYETYEIMKKMDLPIPHVDWYKSSFVRIEAVEAPKIHIPPVKDFQELYFDEESWATPGH